MPQKVIDGRSDEMSRQGFFDMPPDWQKHWREMPVFNQKDLAPYQSIKVNFRSPEDREAFGRLIDRGLTNKTQSIWWPREEIGRMVDKLFLADPVSNPRHPIYVISKGRWESRMTSKALERMNVPYRIVVEPQERGEYASVIDPSKILVLPFSNLGQGSIPARNWVWEHSVREGHAWHWIMDDNINGFYRLYNNIKTPVGCGSVFGAVEDFVERYDNVGQAGLNYFMFASRKTIMPPFCLNTRIYSCILIRNDVYPEGSRWRGRYNEDTDLSLRVLKDGWCTVLFNAFLAMKQSTMTMKGGNTEELYAGDGRYEMAKSLKDQHPDCVEITKKWGRWQHQVDYGRFKRNKLRPKSTSEFKDRPNEFGMYLKYLSKDELEPEQIVLIGQAPGRNGDPSDPLGGKIGRRLAKLAGVSIEEYEDRTERMNMFDEWPGKAGKGDAWDKEAARDRAAEILPELEDRRILFVGRNVAAAFGFGKIPWLKWIRDDESDMEVAVIPHPSGIVTWWNEGNNKRAAAEFLSETFNGE